MFNNFRETPLGYMKRPMKGPMSVGNECNIDTKLPRWDLHLKLDDNNWLGPFLRRKLPNWNSTHQKTSIIFSV